MLLEDALRQRSERGTLIGADELVERVRAELAGSAGADQMRSSFTRVRWRRAALVFAAAFLLVIGAISLVLLFPTQPADEPAVTTTVPVTTAAPQPTSTTEPPTTTALEAATTTTATQFTTTTAVPIPPVPAGLGIAWTEIESPAFAGGWISAVTEGGPGLVAVGGARTGYFGPNTGQAHYAAGVWVSDDGLDWERVDSSSFRGDVGTDGPIEPGANDAYMSDVAAGPAGLVAVGSQDGFAAVWVSLDGLSWSRIPRDEAVFGAAGSIERIVAAPFGFVALGSVYEAGADVVVSWVSADGSDWARTELPTNGGSLATDYTGFGDTRLDLGAWGDRVIAVGGLERNGEWTYVPAVWLTSDGFSWEQIPGSGGGTIEFDDVGDGATFGAVAVGPGGPIAFGWMNDVVRYPDPVVWTSDSGRAWDLVPSLFYADNVGWPASLAASGNRLLLAVGLGDVRLLGSDDGGLTWHVIGEFRGGLTAELAASSAAEMFFTVNDVAGVGDAVVVVGRTGSFSSADELAGQCMRGSGACRTDAAVWIGSWDN